MNSPWPADTTTPVGTSAGHAQPNGPTVPRGAFGTEAGRRQPERRSGPEQGNHHDAPDFQTGTASIRCTLQRRQTGGLTALPTKTRAFERRIALPSECIRSFKGHREVQEGEQEAAAEDRRDNGLVFSTPAGGSIDPANLNRSFHALLDRAGLRCIRVHDIRHSTATLLLEQGVELVVVKELFGHAHIGVTSTVCAHVRLRLQRTPSTSSAAPSLPDRDHRPARRRRRFAALRSSRPLTLPSTTQPTHGPRQDTPGGAYGLLPLLEHMSFAHNFLGLLQSLTGDAPQFTFKSRDRKV
ncbi:tyrosine-type recombinase/integrase [Kitasatospora purpeofusca]|uniref:tyrosine-type recombinase/integrase n=1 Tax=Kitasatospora purpeofusca TaxID=67352 RepID=UPI0036AFCED0